MDYLEFDNINDITLKLINQNSTSEQLDEYYHLCATRLKKARVATDDAVQSISRWNNIHLTKLE